MVWFGETLDTRRRLAGVGRPPSATSSSPIGTSAVVYPAAGFIEQARQHGAFTVEINPEATPATEHASTWSLRGGAETILPEIDQQIRIQASVV